MEPPAGVQRLAEHETPCKRWRAPRARRLSGGGTSARRPAAGRRPRRGTVSACMTQPSAARTAAGAASIQLADGRPRDRAEQVTCSQWDHGRCLLRRRGSRQPTRSPGRRPQRSPGQLGDPAPASEGLRPELIERTSPGLLRPSRKASSTSKQLQLSPPRTMECEELCRRNSERSRARVQELVADGPGVEDACAGDRAMGVVTAPLRFPPSTQVEQIAVR